MLSNELERFTCIYLRALFLRSFSRSLITEIHISCWAHFLGVDKLSSRWQSVNTLLMAFRVKRNSLKLSWKTVSGRICLIWMVLKHTCSIFHFWKYISRLNTFWAFISCLGFYLIFIIPSSSNHLYASNNFCPWK